MQCLVSASTERQRWRGLTKYGVVEAGMVEDCRYVCPSRRCGLGVSNEGVTLHMVAGKCQDWHSGVTVASRRTVWLAYVLA